MEFSPPTPANLAAFVRADVLARPIFWVHASDARVSLPPLAPDMVAWPLARAGSGTDGLELVPCVLLPGTLPLLREPLRHALFLDHFPSVDEVESVGMRARHRLVAALAEGMPLAPARFRFSVIVATLERLSQAMAAIRALCQQSFDVEAFEVLVVDNSPDAGPLREALERLLSELGERRPQVRLLHMPIAGVSLARNVGVAVAQGEIICSVDDDCRPRADWLAALDRAWRAAPEAAVIGGKIILRLPVPQPEVFQAGWEPIWSGFPLPDNGLIIPAVDWRSYPWGGNWSARREALWQIGGFPVRYGRAGNTLHRGFGARGAHNGGEEIAAAAAIAKVAASEKGRAVLLCPAATVEHHPAADRFTMAHVRHTLAASALLEYRLYRDGLIPSATSWAGTVGQLLRATATMTLAILTGRRRLARDRWLRLGALGEKLLVQTGLRADGRPGLDSI